MTDLDRCLVCRTRTPRAGYTCDRCLTRMRRQLDDLPAYYALAAGELGITSGVGNGRGNEIPLGINVAALDTRLASGSLAILGSWAKLFREDLGLLDCIDNLLPACRACNGDKRDLLLSEWPADRERRGLPPRRTTFDPADPRLRHLSEMPGIGGIPPMSEMQGTAGEGFLRSGGFRVRGEWP